MLAKRKQLHSRNRARGASTSITNGSYTKLIKVTNRTTMRGKNKNKTIFFCIAIVCIGIMMILNENPSTENTREADPRNLIKSYESSKHIFNQNALERPHPHAGAKYPNGTLGLIIDPSTKKFKLGQTKLKRERSCIVDDAIDEVAFQVFRGIRSMIKAKSTLDTIKMNKDNENYKSAEGSTRTAPRILCMIYTHSNEHSRVKAIVNTWGKDCDGFFAASNVTDLSINAINLSHEGPEEYENMWQKVRSMWAYAHDHFLNDYDYFHISGDDSVIVADNMKVYLQGKQISRLLNGHIDNISRALNFRKWENMESGQQRPLLLGIPLLFHESMFPLGGSGYTLNREALRLIGVEGGPLDTEHTEEKDSREDLFISLLLRKVDTVISDTRDDTGAFRYMTFAPGRKVRWKTKFPPQFGIPMRKGMDQFSNETVALHLKTMDRLVKMDEVIYRTYDILSGECDDMIF